MFNDNAHVPAGNTPLGSSMALLAGDGSFDQGAALRDPANEAKLADAKSLIVYVRKSGDDGRVLSFRIPEGVDQLLLLKHGFAFDGNQVVGSIGSVTADSRDDVTDQEYIETISYDGPFAVSKASLTDALNAVEFSLATILIKHGFDVSFR